MDRYWDLISVKLIVIGGDGAGWVESGKEEMPFSVLSQWLPSFQGLWSWLAEQPIYI
jgi:hypothetical protein